MVALLLPHGRCSLLSSLISVSSLKQEGHIDMYNLVNELNDYQTKALAFRLKTAGPLYAMLNLPGEVGELLSLDAKRMRDGMKMDYFDNVKKELGDILWCLAAIAEDNGFTLSSVASANIDKLASRKASGTIGGSGDNR
jgi:NTP pyrophosphatase (non-canonical NTP hydrolase)